MRCRCHGSFSLASSPFSNFIHLEFDFIKYQNNSRFRLQLGTWNFDPIPYIADLRKGFISSLRDKGALYNPLSFLSKSDLGFCWTVTVVSLSTFYSISLRFSDLINSIYSFQIEKHFFFLASATFCEKDLGNCVKKKRLRLLSSASLAVWICIVLKTFFCRTIISFFFSLIKILNT